MLRQVVCPYVRATPSLQGTQLYLLAKVIIFHQFSTFLCLLFEGQHINDYSATVLTEEQREQLLALSDDLPGLLERLDARKHVRDKENNLTEVLSEYFLKSYLSSIL